MCVLASSVCLARFARSPGGPRDCCWWTWASWPCSARCLPEGGWFRNACSALWCLQTKLVNPLLYRRCVMKRNHCSLYLWASPFPSLSECCRWQWSGWCSSLSRRPRPSSSEKWPWIGWRICLSTRRARRASILSNFRPEFSTGNLTNYIQAWTCAVESFKQVFSQFVLSFQAKYNHSQMPSCRNLEPLVISYQKFKMFGQSHILLWNNMNI